MAGWVFFDDVCQVTEGPQVQSCAGGQNTNSHMGDAVGVSRREEEITAPASGPNPAGGI